MAKATIGEELAAATTESYVPPPAQVKGINEQLPTAPAPVDAMAGLLVVTPGSSPDCGMTTPLIINFNGTAGFPRQVRNRQHRHCFT